ncbi:hypothetical protein BOBR111200_14305 [Bordetella bronchialis]
MNVPPTAASRGYAPMSSFAEGRGGDPSARTRPGGGSAGASGVSCACEASIAAFESAQGPRRKRGTAGTEVPEGDALPVDSVECVDPGRTETEPATMVFRTAARNSLVAAR